jgi:hypothetical protein
MDSEAKRIIALKEELRRDLEAIERVERLMAFKNGALKAPDERQGVLGIGVVEFGSDEGEDEDQTTATSLKGTIEATINADCGVRWTNQKMLSHLNQVGFKLRAKKPIYSIGQAMQKLSDSGKIRLVRKGAGNQPNIYKGKQKDQQAGSEAPSAEKQGGDVESTQTSIQ